MAKLWDKNTEIEFFKQASKFANPEQLFYKANDNKYYAYWPKGYEGLKNTLQSRNSLIGNFTEKWSVDLIQEFARSKGLFAVQGVVCEEIGLSKQSVADVAICKTNDVNQKAENILMLFEVKMSVVWNWERKTDGTLECIGDFTQHQGNPGLLISDSMLKAIGKSINIRVSSFNSAKIPIIVLGNTPVTSSYYSKVDHLKTSGIIQGFWSVNPKPRDVDTIKDTEGSGFLRMDSIEEFYSKLNELFSEDRKFFSGMRTKKQLGQIIEIANKEETFEKKAEKFLSLIRTEEDDD